MRTLLLLTIAATLLNAQAPAPPPVPHLKAGNAAAGEHGEFVFAIESDKQPEIEITNIKTTLPPAKAWSVGKLWVYETSLKTGSAYSFNWTVDGKSIGRRQRSARVHGRRLSKSRSATGQGRWTDRADQHGISWHEIQHVVLRAGTV